MTDPLVPRVGGVLSADIAVPELEREVRFYSRVLTTGKDPLWREDLTNNVGAPVIGLGPRSAPYDHFPLQWMPHFQVAQVRASVKRALELGGEELMLDETGQWSVLLDPGGAAFGIIAVVPAEELPPMDASTTRVGRIAWVDLTVPDAPATRDFYRQVMGWSVRAAAPEEAGERHADTTMIDARGNPVAGIRSSRGVNPWAPPVWRIHLPVGDLSQSVRRVQEEGGEILQSTRGDDEAYAWVEVQDPVGASFALVQG